MTLRSRGRRDEGIALVVALMITLLVFLLTTAILADAFHSVVASAKARERLTAIGAAEAGVAWYANKLEMTSVTNLKSSTYWSGSSNTYTSSSVPVSGSPGGGSFVLTAKYWTDSGLTSPTDLTTLPTPLWVELLSAGKAGSVVRTVRAVLQLQGIRSSVSGGIAGIFICELGNRFTITGPFADLILVGDQTTPCPADALLVTSGQFQTSGSVYVVNGSATLSNTSKIDGNLWAKYDIKLGSGALSLAGSGGGGGGAAQCNTQNNASILICGDATSLEGSVSMNNTSRVLGLAGQCAGCYLPAPDFPQITQITSPPPSPPQFQWSDFFPTSAGWPAAASATSISTGAELVNNLKNASSTDPKRIFRVTSCTTPLEITNATFTLGADVAVVSPCGFEFGGRLDVRAASNASATLYLITTYGTNCTMGAKAGDRGDLRDTVFRQNFDASSVRTFIYTPCKLIFKNQVNLRGQIIARAVYGQGQTTINTVDILGLTAGVTATVTGFRSRVLNMREI